jgi:hypothetical protein
VTDRLLTARELDLFPDADDPFPHLGDAEFEAVLARLSPPTVEGLADVCRCGVKESIVEVDDVLGPWCSKCSRRAA